MYRHVLRPILFGLTKNDPERAHILTARAVRTIQQSSLALSLTRAVYQRGLYPDPVTIAGVTFPNRVGLAAGFDKNAQMLPFLQAVGFGHVEIGTVLPRPQAGNPRVRMFRIPEQEALINRMGFNSDGVENVANNLSRVRSRITIPIGGSVGKMKDTPLDKVLDDYTTVMNPLAPYVDYWSINISSPNTPGLRLLQTKAYLYNLVCGVVGVERGLRQRYPGTARPIFFKLAPDLANDDLYTAIVAIVEGGADGLILGNSTTARPDYLSGEIASEAGGYTGPWTFARTIETLGIADRRAPGFPVIACGGITNAHRARIAFNRGAKLVQGLTGMVYQGLDYVREMRKAA